MAHHGNMTKAPARTHPIPKQSVAAAGMEALKLVAATGLLRCAVPPALGGEGGSFDDLAQGAADLARCHGPAAWVLWAQRCAIEALVQSSNIGVRDYLLPDLLEGQMAATLPLSLEARPLLAEEDGSAYRLYGMLEQVPNLQRDGFLLIAPIRRGDHAIEWAVLRSEADGLHVGIDHGGDDWRGSRTATVTLDGMYFRLDEWIGGPELLRAMSPVLRALAPAGACDTGFQDPERA